MMIAADSREIPLRDQCVHCVVTSPPYWGLRDYGQPGQLGLERTPQLYLTEMRKVFREVWRVLRDDGTAWVNMGDSYATGTTSDRTPTQTGKHGYWENPAINMRIDGREFGLKPKDLCGIPWRLAFALQEDGWYLRSDIIWAKPNPMPESVTDRPTKSHEYVFLLAKQERYFYDAEAVKQNVTGNAHERGDGNNPKRALGIPGMMRSNQTFTANELVSSRNLRSVWNVATQPYSGAHFATFPEKLVEPCIRAGTSAKGVCLQCGAPWERVTREIKGRPASFNGSQFQVGKSREAREHLAAVGEGERTIEFQTIGWSPTCLCRNQHSKTSRAIVLDPFGGSGTVGRVATRLGRQGILVDIGYRDKYASLAKERNSLVQMELVP